MSKAILYLEDGTCFEGKSFGADGEILGEVVFNTGMTGYQEILTDPSYKYQIVTMTYPMIGNVGVNIEDTESNQVQASGFVVKEYSKTHSNYRSTQSLGDYLKENNIVSIEDIDTRSLTRHIRDKGAMRGIISTTTFDLELLQKKVLASPQMAGMDLVKKVTTNTPYTFTEKSNTNLLAYPDIVAKENANVTVYDYGVKKNILRKLTDRGCNLTVVPAGLNYQEMLDTYKPDGIFLSNGPGDPAAVTYAVKNIKGLLNKGLPIFGICLGHQLLSIALGAKTYKLKFGHRGSNQPVKNLDNDRVEITSQNHGFVVDEKTIDNNLVELTHINLNDQTTEGISLKGKPVFSAQYHPEASPGPHDSDYLFDKFVSLL